MSYAASVLYGSVQLRSITTIELRSISWILDFCSLLSFYNILGHDIDTGDGICDRLLYCVNSVYNIALEEEKTGLIGRAEPSGCGRVFLCYAHRVWTVTL